MRVCVCVGQSEGCGSCVVFTYNTYLSHLSTCVAQCPNSDARNTAVSKVEIKVCTIVVHLGVQTVNSCTVCNAKEVLLVCKQNHVELFT